jgi:hypothetical protein
MVNNNKNTFTFTDNRKNNPLAINLEFAVLYSL